MTLENFTCPNCGASIEANPQLPTVTCNACGTSFTPDMDTAKLVVNRISGTVNKMIDNYESHRVDRMAEREQQRKYALMIAAGGMVFIIIMFIVLGIILK